MLVYMKCSQITFIHLNVQYTTILQPLIDEAVHSEHGLLIKCDI
jgi:hypothetical protein